MKKLGADHLATRYDLQCEKACLFQFEALKK